MSAEHKHLNMCLSVKALIRQTDIQQLVSVRVVREHLWVLVVALRPATLALDLIGGFLAD